LQRQATGVQRGDRLQPGAGPREALVATRQAGGGRLGPPGSQVRLAQRVECLALASVVVQLLEHADRPVGAGNVVPEVDVRLRISSGVP
jgi:hypothetical protein